jgi:hypothetical protein
VSQTEDWGKHGDITVLLNIGAVFLHVIVSIGADEALSRLLTMVQVLCVPHESGCLELLLHLGSSQSVNAVSNKSRLKSGSGRTIYCGYPVENL